ncbi:MAG TPA: rubrerythrin family protein [Bacteroidales bacterium]|nr:rubrerythrin family protein [Bacteroidales bacterium]HRS17963.1 rubrerythrin family protein [Bacteroidales bacterium]
MQNNQILIQSFANECTMRTMYDMFAKQARSEGYIRIAQMFDEFALHELSHAKNFQKFFDNSIVDVSMHMTIPKLDTTIENIRTAIAAEIHDAELYGTYSEIAKAEGNTKLSAKFKHIAIAEQFHRKQLEKVLYELKNNLYFYSNEPIEWYCIKCGYTHVGETPPLECPACNHPQGYFTQTL